MVYQMKATLANGRIGTPRAEEASRGLELLSKISFDQLDAEEILRIATATVETLGPCRVEATYRSVGRDFILCPRSQPKRPQIVELAREADYDGQVQIPCRTWGWALGLRSQNMLAGCMVVSAANKPARQQFLLLTTLAQQTAAALASADMHHRDTVANQTLATKVERLQEQTNVHEVLSAALAAGLTEQGIADTLHQLTALSVVLEDRFGNLRCWAGPGRPECYPKPTSDQRETFLHQLATHGGPMRIQNRMTTLVQPRAEILGVLALIDPQQHVTNNQLFALRYGSTVLGLELSHQRHVAEIELDVRRELVDDLLAGTEEDSAYARAEALGHDLRRPHYVVVMQTTAGHAEISLAAAAGPAATALHLNYLQGRHARLVVLLTDGRPEPRALYRALTRHLGARMALIGIGSRCEVPRDIPQSFADARRALAIRLHSATPQGASAYDELGFYRLIYAAHRGGAVEDYVREWLGALLDYDHNKNSELVSTLAEYFEHGGNYNKSAAALHIHRSTLRYRLDRIRQLTNYDLSDVDTRFNLHAATRAWRFLHPDT
jgi:sugar diacid utilization regulator